MTQIVINSDYGGFDLSDTAHLLYLELAGYNIPEYRWEIRRDDPMLVQVVLRLGAAANTRYSSLKVVEVPDGVEWTIHEYDGREWVAEAHRTWN
jgi:hypothetical protein